MVLSGSEGSGGRPFEVRRAILDTPGNRQTLDDNEPGVMLAVVCELAIVDDAVERVAFGFHRQRVKVARHHYAAAKCER